MNKHLRTIRVFLLICLSSCYSFSQQMIQFRINQKTNNESKTCLNDLLFWLPNEKSCNFTVTDSTMKIENYSIEKGNQLKMNIDGYSFAFIIDTLSLNINISPSNSNDSLNTGQINCTYSETLEDWYFDLPSLKPPLVQKAKHYSLYFYIPESGFMPVYWKPFYTIKN